MKKMSKKHGQNNNGISTLLIAIIVAVVIVVAGVAAYILMNQNIAPSESPQQTSTPQPTSQETTTASPSPSLTQIPNPSVTQNVSGANSLQYTVSETYPDGTTKVMTFYGKNIGTNNFMVRIDSTNPRLF